MQANVRLRPQCWAHLEWPLRVVSHSEKDWAQLGCRVHQQAPADTVALCRSFACAARKRSRGAIRRRSSTVGIHDGAYRLGPHPGSPPPGGHQVAAAAPARPTCPCTYSGRSSRARPGVPSRSRPHRTFPAAGSQSAIETASTRVSACVAPWVRSSRAHCEPHLAVDSAPVREAERDERARPRRLNALVLVPAQALEEQLQVEHHLQLQRSRVVLSTRQHRGVSNVRTGGTDERRVQAGRLPGRTRD